ncbi:MAG: class I SAM-dependent methyltransferase [Acidobacteria bacterium]|nr:class I SAM-dependent methyltransferase [Acidobacteriota bacterium]
MQERILEQEMLDSATDQEAARNLRDITRINAITGAKREMLRQIRQYFGPKDEFRFLDVGAASGDLARAISAHFKQSTSFCLDLQFRNLKLAPHNKIQADAFRLPFPDGAFEIVHCSLFLHHFDSSDTKLLLDEMNRVASKLVLIQDLHRHWISYYFLPVTRLLLGWNRITVEDGMKSVAAGWRRNELESILSCCGLLQQSKIRWHFPSFRYFIAIQAVQRVLY